MKVSERIIEWIERYDKLEVGINQFSIDVHELHSHAYPFAGIEITRALAQATRQEGIMEYWDSLKQSWDKCSGSLEEKFQAVYKRIEERGCIPDFIKKLIDRDYAFVSDKNRAIGLFEQNKRLESQAASFVGDSPRIGEELTEYACGQMVFSFEAEVKYDKDFKIFDKEPITLLTHCANITNFPHQDFPDLAKRFLKASYQDGFYYFKLLGTMDDDEKYTTLEESLGEISGETADAEQIIKNVDLREVRSLRLLISETKEFPKYLFLRQKFERMDLDKLNSGEIIFGEALSRRRENCIKPCNECIRSLANIIDGVAESYRR